MKNVEASTNELNQLMQNANKLVSNENIENIELFMANLAQISTQVQTSIKELDKGLASINGLVGDARGFVSAENSDMAQFMKTAANSMFALSNKLDSITNEIESASMNLNEATNLIRKNPSQPDLFIRCRSVG